MCRIYGKELSQTKAVERLRRRISCTSDNGEGRASAVALEGAQSACSVGRQYAAPVTSMYQKTNSKLRSIDRANMRDKQLIYTRLEQLFRHAGRGDFVLTESSVCVEDITAKTAKKRPIFGAFSFT